MRQYCEPKTLTRILMPTPFLVLNVFRNRKFSETQKGSLTKSFGTVKQNSFTENPDTPTPLMHEKFRNQIFSETMKASLRNVSIQRDKKFLGQSWCPPTFFSLTFFQKIFSETQKGSSTKCFGTVRWNHFDAQSWRPPPFLSLIFFDFRKIWNTERSLYEKFRYHEIKKFDGESWCVPTFFSLTFFDIKNFWNTERFIYEVFGYCETKTSNGKSWNPSPSYAWKISIVKLLKHKKVPLRNFSVLWAKKVDEDRDARPLCLPQHFSISKTFWNTEGFLYEWFATGKQTFSKHSRDPRPFLSSTFSPSGKLSETQKGSLTNSFGIVKENSLTENHDTPPLFMHEKFRC